MTRLMTRRLAAAGLSLTVLCAAGCDDDGAAPAPRTDAADAADAADADTTRGGDDAAAPSGGPAWYGDVQALVYGACTGCHQEGGLAPFSLVTYEETAPLATLLAASAEAETMPPFGAKTTEMCSPPKPFAHDLTLSPEAIAALRAWADAGAPAGDPAATVAAPAPTTAGLPRVDKHLVPDTPFVTQGAKDQFRCVVLDPGFDEDSFMKATRVVPDDESVVHHVLVYTDPQRRSLDKIDADGGYTCFGGPGVPDTTLVGTWVPGSEPIVLQDGVGIPVEAGTLFVMQMHYFPDPGGAAKPDATSLEVMLTDETPEWHSRTFLVGNFDFPVQFGVGLEPGDSDPAWGPAFVVPAGATDHVERMRYTMTGSEAPGQPSEYRLAAVAPHMHYVGTDLHVSVTHGDPAAAPCSAEEIDPLYACVVAGCLGAENLGACVEAQCSPELQALSGRCGLCLEEADGGLAEIVSTCQEADPEAVTPPGFEAEQCLVHVPAWDFGWQRFYFYDAPLDELPVLRLGDELTMTCRYDNSLANPFVADALSQLGKDAPEDVWLGEETLDEMCLVGLQLLWKP